MVSTTPGSWSNAACTPQKQPAPNVAFSVTATSSPRHKGQRPGRAWCSRWKVPAWKAVIFTQYYLDCLSHASYLVGDEGSGEAVVVDPQRDVSAYLADAEAVRVRIRYVIETHFHADFLSGHLELAAQTGAEICFGAAAE